jgi:putative endonuclease
MYCSRGGGGLKNLYKQKIGRWGEAAASEYLVAQGCSLVATTVRTPEGEIRFVEVKSRTSRKFGYPEESITRNKYEHMYSAAEWYLSNACTAESTWHLDVVAVYGNPDSNNIELKWFKDVEVG